MAAFKEWTNWAHKQGPVDSIFNSDFAITAARSDSAAGYWAVYWKQLDYFGLIALQLANQQSGQGASERLHNAEKSISTKTRVKLRSDVKDALTEVKMSQMRKRCERVNEQKTYKRGDRVTVLGLV